jgi:hypothetical protein
VTSHFVAALRVLRAPRQCIAVLTRRRFVFLSGVGASGLWLAGTGLLRLPERMVLALSGNCSFCGKATPEVPFLAGVAGRAARICDECVGLCLDIVAEQPDGYDRRAAARSDAMATREEEAISDEELERLLRRAAESQDVDAGAFQDLVASVRRALDGADTLRPKRGPRPTFLQCSFCDRKQHVVRKLVAGPLVYICDGCIGDAAALFPQLLHG